MTGNCICLDKFSVKKKKTSLKVSLLKWKNQTQVQDQPYTYRKSSLPLLTGGKMSMSRIQAG